jgi:hypothetical protein
VTDEILRIGTGGEVRCAKGHSCPAFVFCLGDTAGMRQGFDVVCPLKPGYFTVMKILITETSVRSESGAT